MRKVTLAIFVTLSLLIFRPLLNNLWYPMHDSTSVARTYLLERTLASPQFPAIWAAELNGGQGYPLFHFYAPLITYLSLLGKTVTTSYFMGIKLVLILSSLFGMVGMYLLMRRWGRGAGIVAAVAYLLLPYAALNLYVRGAYAEYLSMSLLPWVFYVWRDLSTARREVLTAFITSLFLLSHNLIPLITAPFLLVWILLNNSKRLWSIALPALLTLTLSAFFLVPLLFERNFVRSDAIAKTTDYSLHFVAPSQLWNSAWGYGGSAIGVEDGMSFKLGKLQLILAGLGSLVVILKRRPREYFFLAAALLAAFMTTPYSAFIWQSIPFLPLVQFPWRFLAIVGFFVSILAGYSLSSIKMPWLQLSYALIIIVGLLFLNLKLFTPQFTFPADLTRFTSNSYLATIPSIVPEYAPYWLGRQNPPVEGSTILPYSYYPTWEVKLNGAKVATYPSVDGQLAFFNPANSTNYTVRQSHTQLENFASILSVVTLIILIKLYVKA